MGCDPSTATGQEDGREIMISSVEGCSSNSSLLRPHRHSGMKPCPSPFLERDPLFRARGLWRLGPLGQNHGGKYFQSKNSPWVPRPVSSHISPTCAPSFPLTHSRQLPTVPTPLPEWSPGLAGLRNPASSGLFLPFPTPCDSRCMWPTGDGQVFGLP